MLLDSLSSNASVSKFYTTKMGNDQDRLFGLFLCYNFVETQKCENCIASAIQDIKNRCENRNEAVMWEENCELRYSNESFFGTLDVTGNIFQYNSENVSDDELGQFISVVNNTMHKLSKLAAFNASYGMYATEAVNFRDTKTIYALVQCTTDLSPDDSDICKYWMTIGLAIGSAILIVALVGFCVYCLAIRNQTKTKRQVSGQEVQLHETRDPKKIDVHHQNLQARDNLNSQNFPFIDLVTLSAATDNFSASNKLGQGGFGLVYKGQLLDGREVAVKRLSSCSKQGLDEFTNEVLLILKLQHKNLVRLLGFCIDGEESCSSMNTCPMAALMSSYLVHPRKRAQMNWSRRLNIINGIARGMLYLHQDSRLRIIHRDLKPSNVLLDSELNPKISDFGLARIFGRNDGAINTAKIVGTYGYMAPEFAMKGLYSIKSDVFSFGVLLIEIITGMRNANFHLTKCAPSLIAYVWQLWNEGKGLELIDPLLTVSCDLDEFLRYMHIGLLCVQEDAYDRPTMSSVVVMLKNDIVTLSQPERPAFS
ncbi:unnamed protein product [Camellia sinensis]